MLGLIRYCLCVTMVSVIGLCKFQLKIDIYNCNHALGWINKI